MCFNSDWRWTHSPLLEMFQDWRWVDVQGETQEHEAGGQVVIIFRHDVIVEIF